MHKKSSKIVGMGLGLYLAACSKEEAPATGAAPAPAVQAPAQGSALPANARVFFIEPQNGAEVKGALVEGKVNVHVKMGVEGLTVREAGEQQAGTGHHHIIVDAAGVDQGAVVPKDETHLHFGKGQTEADVPLTPGSHTLTLQFADGVHLSYGPPLAQTITVNVAADPHAAAPAVAEPSAAPAK